MIRAWEFVPRAELLAAVALVVGARREPVATLRRLAHEDPALARLLRVAAQCEAGRSLPEALAATGILSADEAAQLSGAAPAVLGEELTRLAESSFSPTSGEVIERWLPAWAIVVATFPSLIIGAGVVACTGSAYAGLWSTLGFGSPLVTPASWYGAQVAATLIALILVVGSWYYLRSSSWFSWITIISPALHRAATFSALLRGLRGGSAPQPLWAAWRKFSGERKLLDQALIQAGGDHLTALIDLGVLPRTAAGRPAWDIALAEAEHQRQRAGDLVTPLLMTLLIFVGVGGFVAWGTSVIQPYYQMFEGPSSIFSHHLHTGSAFVGAILTLTLGLLSMAGGTVVSAFCMVPVTSPLSWLVGPARDWPLVADRVARAMERRESIDVVLRGLRLAVKKPMRRCLARALGDHEPLPGVRLVRAGIVPRAQRTMFAKAEGADLVPLLRAAADQSNDHGVRHSLSQSQPTLLVAIVVVGILGYLNTGVFPKFKTMFESLQSDRLSLGNNLVAWAVCAIQLITAGVFLGIIVAALGQRFGWWSALGGWSRLGRGMVLRRLLRNGAPETELARVIRQVAPTTSTTLEACGMRGDLPGILRVSGWSATTAVELDRALAAHLRTADRRRAHAALAVRLALPMLFALPVGLVFAGTMSFIVEVQKNMNGLARHSGGGGGGTPSMALLYWWTTRCEAEGEAAVEAQRSAAIDPPRAPTHTSKPLAPPAMSPPIESPK